MEVVDVTELPMDLGMQDRGYAVKVSALATILTWNGKQWCHTVESGEQLPMSDVEPGTCYYVGEFEYEYNGTGWSAVPAESDMVNHPPHYTRGPTISVLGQGKWEPVERTVECIEVVRHISDFRLATAVKYLWRVAFGGKENNDEDIRKAIFYLNDYLDNKIEGRK